MKNELNSGLIYLFTGTGKGKTSAALGVCLRSLLIGKKVVWISWYKSSDWQISEKLLVDKFPNDLKMHWVGKGFYMPKIEKINGEKVARVNSGLVKDFHEEDEHKFAARLGLELAEQVLKEAKVDLLVLDELVQAVDERLVAVEEVKKMLKERRGVNVVMTGRSVSKELEEVADLVTEMVKVKHPFDVGRMAIKGLDY